VLKQIQQTASWVEFHIESSVLLVEETGVPGVQAYVKNLFDINEMSNVYVFLIKKLSPLTTSYDLTSHFISQK
jgi:hypothetical protein